MSKDGQKPSEPPMHNFFLSVVEDQWISTSSCWSNVKYHSPPGITIAYLRRISHLTSLAYEYLNTIFFTTIPITDGHLSQNKNILTFFDIDNSVVKPAVQSNVNSLQYNLLQFFITLSIHNDNKKHLL